MQDPTMQHASLPHDEEQGEPATAPPGSGSDSEGDPGARSGSDSEGGRGGRSSGRSRAGHDGPKAARKAAKKAAKEAKRLQRAGLTSPDLGRKPCTLCGRRVDLLVRCQVDASGRWEFACGKCWLAASGGRVDGTPEAPHYRYGGLWKNHHSAISGKGRVPKGASAPAPAAGPPPGRGGDQPAPPSDLEQLLLSAAAAPDDPGDDGGGGGNSSS